VEYVIVIVIVILEFDDEYLVSWMDGFPDGE
jgi:hypothetical protein